MSAVQRAIQTPGGPGVEFLEFLQEQRSAYRRGLTEKFAQMAALWQRIAEGHGGTAAILELERQAHGMAGSGATFGYRHLGAGARALELAVHRLLECRASPSAAQRAEIAAAMRAVNHRIPSEAEETPGLEPC